ncbi:MAG: C25 family cysteine peptidase, partial [Caldisericia bacterium]|nr:C25 family cysteine peptidase [Caldisericia bacterium]
MLHTKKYRWMYSFVIVFLMASTGYKPAQGFEYPSQYIVGIEERRTQSYTISFHEEDFQYHFNKGMVELDVKDFSTLLIPGQPTLLYKSITQSISYNIDLYIEKISWSPLKMDNGSYMPAHILKSSPDMYATDGTTREKHGKLPGHVVDYLITGTSQNPLCTILIYPIQIRSGFVFFVQECTFLIVPNLEDPITLGKTGKEKEIIIYPDAWTSSVKKLQHLHQTWGIDSTMMSLSEIESGTYENIATKNNIGAFKSIERLEQNKWGFLETWNYELASKIRLFLKSNLKEDPHKYVTLIGDNAIIPTSVYASYSNMDFNLTHDFYNEMLPSDFFYMSPNGGDKKLIIESSCGRIPVRTEEELQRYIEKVACWYENVDIEWFSKMAFIGGDLFQRDYVGEMLCQHIINQLPGVASDFTKLYATEGKCNDKEATALLQKGQHGFVTICAHGSGSEIRLEPGFFDVRDSMNLEKEEKVPIVFSYSCMNGAYDSRDSGITYETDPVFGVPTSFGQSLLFSPAGSIAFVGGARVNYSSFSVEKGYNGEVSYKNPQQMDAMCVHFSKNIAYSNSLGEICSRTLTEYLQENYLYDFSLHSFVGFTLLGDPTLPILHPSEASETSLPTMSVEVKSIIVDDESTYYPTVFLDKNCSLEMEMKNCSKILVFDYTNPSNVQFSGNVSGKTNIVLPLDFSPKTSIRCEDEAGNEMRFFFLSANPYSISLEHPYTRIKHAKAGEKLPYFYSLSQDGYKSIHRIESSLRLIDEKGVVVYSDKKILENIPRLRSVEKECLIPLPTKQGKYTAEHSIEGFSGDPTTHENTELLFSMNTEQWLIDTTVEKDVCRIGIPINTGSENKMNHAIPIETLNTKLDTLPLQDQKIEFCIIPNHSLEV